ncbi:MAG: YggS family pyridoxal phosphate-dependent enzyme [Desulfobacterales bacterium]|nr:YggS family pyridoxal phosphate-dependent enzyme [Desulfobacterales bacterium]MCP4160664.1 YggS family pyridoxal phosphate-dependent enzyme [Deltaproteobacteria bacterium]
MNKVIDKIKNIEKRLIDTAKKCGRDHDSVKLVAVSKKMSQERVRVAIESGAKILGENYIQEAREKIEALKEYDVSWHFIGHLQSNKAKYAVKIFDMIHTVDSVKLAKEIDKQAKKIDKIQEILIQINISEEESKSGVSADKTIQIIKEISRFDNIRIKGLMGMPPYYDNPEMAKPYFVRMKEIQGMIEAEKIEGVLMDELSMGMTGDFEVAIQEGSTLVRIGTAIFGARS